jgi:hypothetical protein
MISMLFSSKTASLSPLDSPSDIRRWDSRLTLVLVCGYVKLRRLSFRHTVFGNFLALIFRFCPRFIQQAVI